MELHLLPTVQRMEQIIGQALVRLISGPTYKEILRIIGGSEPSEEDYLYEVLVLLACK